MKPRKVYHTTFSPPTAAPDPPQPRPSPTPLRPLPGTPVPAELGDPQCSRNGASHTLTLRYPLWLALPRQGVN